jgi:hypothetical protein
MREYLPLNYTRAWQGLTFIFPVGEHRLLQDRGLCWVLDLVGSPLEDGVDES